MKRLVSLIGSSVFLALLLVSCGPKGKYYAKTPDEVASALRSATVPLHILGTVITRTRVETNDDGSVSTIFIDGRGEDRLKMVAIITPDGEGSRVAMELRPPDGPNAQTMRETMDSDPLSGRIMQSFANEFLNSTLEDRPFDITFGRFSDAPPQARQFIEQANRDIQNFPHSAEDLRAHQMRENVEAMQNAANLNQDRRD